MEYSIHRKKGKCYLFHFFDALLCNLIKLVNILRNYAAREEKRFKRINKLILLFVMKML